MTSEYTLFRCAQKFFHGLNYTGRLKPRRRGCRRSPGKQGACDATVILVRRCPETVSIALNEPDDVHGRILGLRFSSYIFRCPMNLRLPLRDWVCSDGDEDHVGEAVGPPGQPSPRQRSVQFL